MRAVRDELTDDVKKTTKAGGECPFHLVVVLFFCPFFVLCPFFFFNFRDRLKQGNSLGLV